MSKNIELLNAALCKLTGRRVCQITQCRGMNAGVRSELDGAAYAALSLQSDEYAHA